MRGSVEGTVKRVAMLAIGAEFRALKCAAPLKDVTPTARMGSIGTIPRTQMRGSVEGVRLRTIMDGKACNSAHSNARLR